MVNLEWNVYVENFNSKTIECYNIFNHYRFNNEVKENYDKYSNDFEMFAETMKQSLMYYFWSKCEWEIILSCWPPSKKFNEKKVDVYNQVMLNWDKFILYVWQKMKETNDK